MKAFSNGTKRKLDKRYVRVRLELWLGLELGLGLGLGLWLELGLGLELGSGLGSYVSGPVEDCL